MPPRPSRAMLRDKAMAMTIEQESKLVRSGNPSYNDAIRQAMYRKHLKNLIRANRVGVIGRIKRAYSGLLKVGTVLRRKVK